MSTECAKCSEIFTHSEDLLECCNCKNNLHFYCAGVAESSFKKMSQNTKTRFSCQTCREPSQKSDKVISKKSEERMEELIKSVSFMSSQFDEFNKKLDAALLEMNHLRTENNKLKIENTRLANDILDIKQKLDTFEQANMGIGIEITGIPKMENENCINTVKQIAEKLNISITVTEASRLNSTNNKPSIIIAKLETSEMRKNLIKINKLQKLNANMLSENWNKENKIYINERLTKEKRILHSKTRAAGKERNYKFIWISNADILIRKDENSKITRIRSINDIERM